MIYLVHFRGPAMEARDARAGESPCAEYEREIEADSPEQAQELGQAWADAQGEGAEVVEVEETIPDPAPTEPTPKKSSGELAADWIYGGAEVLADGLSEGDTSCIEAVAALLRRFSPYRVLEALRDAADCGRDCVGGMEIDDPKAVDGETGDRLTIVRELLTKAMEQVKA